MTYPHEQLESIRRILRGIDHDVTDFQEVVDGPIEHGDQLARQMRATAKRMRALAHRLTEIADKVSQLREV